jgi:hypothetical protein
MGTTGGDSGEGPVYGFFRNLRSIFGIPHRLEPGDPNRRDKALRIPSPDMYDDTMHADPNSFVQEYESKGNNNNNYPSADNNENTGDDGRRFPFPRRGFDNEAGAFDPFGFGEVFGKMDDFFSEMEREFMDAGKHFGGFGFGLPHGGGGDENDDQLQEGFGLFNDPIMDSDETINGNRSEGRLIPYSPPNLREEVLKPGAGSDDKPDSGGPFAGETGDSSESSLLEVQPTPSQSWSTWSSSKYAGSFSSSVKGFKSQAYSQTIRDTPKGREITTWHQKPDGTSEKTTEFIPREDLPKEALDSGGLVPFGFIRDFFRPRM